jgi:hypothetical protein
MVILAAVVFFLVPPVHTTNPEIVLGMGERALRSLDTGSTPVLELAGFHVSCVLFKSSPLMGAGLWLGLLGALVQWRSRPEVRLLVVFVSVYFIFLLSLEIAQTFYMMPLLPILAIMASDQLFEVARRRKTLAVILALLGAGVLFNDIRLCYPDFNLNGFQWLGARQLGGRSTLGYRSVAQVPADGVEQTLEWANQNVPPGSKVVTYVPATHIVRAVCPDPDFEIVNGLREPAALREDARFVIISLNAEVADDRGVQPEGPGIYHLPYDRTYLEENFREVLAVRRAFDIRVASVWERISR